MSPRTDDVSRYLRQTKELFGDELYLTIQPQSSSPLLDEGFNPELSAFEKEICSCQKCPLGESRNKFVFGVVGLYKICMSINQFILGIFGL